MFSLLSKIFDGATISDTSLGRFCNYISPPTLTSSQNAVLIHFHSDDVIDNTSRGFALYVSGREPGWFVLLLLFRLLVFFLYSSSSSHIINTIST